MTTVMSVMTPLLINRRVQTLVAVIAAVAACLLLGPGEAAAWPKGPW
jgi:hypothetical protein